MNTLATHYDVIVLGGGAAGLMCAATAARRGRRVLILEKSNKLGKKILMSGGGRCNFTNYTVEPDNYISANTHFCKSALSRYTQWDFIALVERYGLAFEERKHGQLFCLQSAKDILDILLTECEQGAVVMRSHCDVKTITSSMNDSHGGKEDNKYTVHVEGMGAKHSLQQFTCQSLVVATGALSIPSLGGSGMGYMIAEQFALPVTTRCAGLVPLMFSSDIKAICERLSGLALEVSLACKGQAFTESLLFTHRGVSGPAVLQISNYWQPGDTLCIDLLPDKNAVDFLLQAKREHGKRRLHSVLNTCLAKALVTELQQLWWPDDATHPLAQFSDSKLIAIGEQLNNWVLKPSGSEGYRTAEVTLGGVDTAAVSSKTMEAKGQAGLYFVGEVLDVSGQLGGFNFQWAWSSGYCAGMFV